MKLFNLLFYNFKIFQLFFLIIKRAIEEYFKHGSEKGIFSLLKCGFKSLFSVWKLKIVFYKKDRNKQFEKLIDILKINYVDDSRFYYWVDENVYFVNRHKLIGNMPVDFSLFIDNSIEDIKKRIIDIQGLDSQYIYTLSIIEKYIDKICHELSSREDHHSKEIVENLKSMKSSKAINLTDAIQRILFLHSILIQTGHTLMGLGRIDVLLDRFEVEDQSETKAILMDFCVQLHKFYEFKSQAMLGDTGQILLIGGKNPDGSYFSNYYTYSFIEIIKELCLPDPKLLLRVSDNTPSDLIGYALDCISTGNGSPLFSNDDVVIPLLEKYGYERIDSFNYAVSACWEPVIIGKSMDQNNLATIPLADIFVRTINTPEADEICSLNDLLELYSKKLNASLDDLIRKVDDINWDLDPFLSLFFVDCISSNKDISLGGATYNNYGILSDGLSNVVNSFLNINRLVFEEREYTISDVRRVLNDNYAGSEKLKYSLSSSDEYFGKDETKVIEITNQIFSMAKTYLRDKKNKYGGGYKVGLSSPEYLIDGSKTGSTFDGRTAGTPLGTHISCDKNVAYTELLSFASQIDYSENGFNGNVVDFMLNPGLIEKNRQKFIDFIKACINIGFFQMQMNVVSSEMLIDAKLHPEKYKQLIVRVWGFSAYYNDLPEKYKDMLIERALKNEGKVA